MRAHMREYARCGVPGARWKAAEGKGWWRGCSAGITDKPPAPRRTVSWPTDPRDRGPTWQLFAVEAPDADKSAGPTPPRTVSGGHRIPAGSTAVGGRGRRCYHNSVSTSRTVRSGEVVPPAYGNSFLLVSRRWKDRVLRENVD